MVRPPLAVHRTILVVDVEGFGDQRRTNPHQVAVRAGLHRVLRQAFDKANIAWSGCHHEDRGDGVFVLAPADVPKSLFVESLPHELVNALREHNMVHCAEERIRLRMALHAGEINYDDYGVTAAAINLAFRLLDAQPLRTALADSPGAIALIASSWFFDEVIRHSSLAHPATYRPVRVNVKETATTGWVCLPDHPFLPADAKLATDLVAPRQLPVHTPHFVGRTEELRRLTALLDTAGEGEPVVISAINGTAGVGKTALAVYWARQVADRFPDGQLYMNLRGFDPTGTPMKPAEAVRGFLDAFEIPPERIPIDLDAQAVLYRGLLVDRKVLLILDNARDTEQVRPLLPGGSTCRVVITSRNQLAGLITQEGARPVNLDVLSTEDAAALLARHLGQDRITAEPDVVTDLIEHCAQLPLALSIVAARAALNPRVPLRVLAEELQDEQIRLDALDAGDPTTSVRAVFSWSYQQLSAQAARTFRLLGVHPGPDISRPAAASLAGVDLRQTREALVELSRAHLVTQNAQGRFAFHDLLRAYAGELARTYDTDVERRTALHRVLDHYLHTAHSAALHIYPRRDLISLAPSQSVPELIADCASALAWFDTEYPVLLANMRLAAAAGYDTHAWQLPLMLGDFFERRGHWHDWAATQLAGLTAAQRSSDQYGQAQAHLGLVRAFDFLGRYAEAESHVRQAVVLFHQAGNHIGEADAYLDIFGLYERQNRHEEALPYGKRALGLYRTSGSRHGQATGLNNIGWCHALLGDYRRAVRYCRRALALCREIGDRRGEAHTLDSLGYALHHLGPHSQAVAYYRQSLALRRELGERYGEATCLAHLGESYHAAGDSRAARDAWQQALGIFGSFGIVRRACLGYPDADEVRMRLAGLDRAP